MNSGDLLKLGGLVFVAVTLVVAGDTAGKILTVQGVAPAFVAWSRFALAVMLIAPFSGLRRSELGAFLNGIVILRAAAIATGISCILMALKSEPIANVYGAFFIGPLVSYVLAIVFLKERPTAARSLLLGLGFVGVLLVVKPGFGLSRGLLFALGAGCCYGTYLMLTRAVAGRYRPRFLLFSQLLLGTCLLAPRGVLDVPWEAELSIWGLVALSALASAAGNYLLVVANQRAEAGLIAPLVYSQLVSAVVFGVLFFADWLDALSLFGLGLILISGTGALFLTRPKI